MHILLVEDNPLTAKGLKYLLEKEQYTVIEVSDLSTARAELAEHNFDLALLDVSLPDGEGFSLAHEIKTQNPSLPVIFLTARDDEDDIVQGLELGADDYIVKPFRNRELLLRIQNSLRRGQSHTHQLICGPLTFDLKLGTAKNGNLDLKLTALESKLLRCFMEHPGQILTRERLLDEIWNVSGSSVNDNTLSVYLRRLRKKLGEATYIETFKNLGYRLKVDSSSKSRES